MKISRGVYFLFAILLFGSLFSSVNASSSIKAGTASTNSSNPSPSLQGGNYHVYLPLIIKEQFTVSRYIKAQTTLPDFDLVKFYNMGYFNYVDSKGVVIFHFGSPCSDYLGGNLYYGATAYKAGCRNKADIQIAVQEFIRGYCDRNGCSYYSATPSLTLALGVSNCSNGGEICANPDQSTNVTYAHGQAWRQLVADVRSYVSSQNYSYQVFVVGAMDIELNFNTAAKTRDWVNGYKQTGYYHLYNFGTCECPIGYVPNPDLPYDWTYDDVWYVSWGGSVVFYPIPEIYKTDFDNAKQWYGVSYYAATVKTGKIYFKGTLTQWQACYDTNMTQCQIEGTNNRPGEGWAQLWNELYQDPITRLTSLPWSTDITQQQP